MKCRFILIVKLVTNGVDFPHSYFLLSYVFKLEQCVALFFRHVKNYLSYLRLEIIIL